MLNNKIYLLSNFYLACLYLLTDSLFILQFIIAILSDSFKINFGIMSINEYTVARFYNNSVGYSINKLYYKYYIINTSFEHHMRRYKQGAS